MCAVTASTHAQNRVTTVKTPPIEGTAHYTANRAPLVPNPLLKLPIGCIRPEGWLRTQLQLDAEGLVGRLSELSPWLEYETSAWVSPDGKGKNGWEELPYWLKGFGDLGYVLGNERIIKEARKWIDGVISTQEADGYFGPRENKTKPDLWPNMPMLNVLQSYYEYSGDKRVLTLLTRYFRWQLDQPGDILPGYWDKMRGGDNLESILWLYNRTGEAWLLDAARKVHSCTAPWTEKVPNWHGVNISQGFKEPAIYHLLSGDPKHRDATERNYQAVMSIYGQVPGGGFGADENCREGYTDPRQCTETCTWVEFMHAFEMLLGFTGDTLQADRCEEIAFNSLPPSLTADHRALHYLTGPNQPQLDRESKAPGIENGGNMFAYDPRSFRCCQHNVAMGWPYYAEHLWMATRGGGLAATLYSDSVVNAKAGPGSGVDVSIVEQTAYPFADKITLTVNPSASVQFPLYLRVPGWCAGAKVSVNGKRADIRPEPSAWILIDRTWKTGDKVVLTLPMELAVRTWTKNKNAVSVDYGPLTFSLKIGEEWKPWWKEGRWTASEVFPTTSWNVGLVLDEKDPVRSFKVSRKRGTVASQPFTPEAAPIIIKAKAKVIPNWGMRRGLADVLQPSPIRSDRPEQDVILIPMGCARLRISSFPVIGEGPDAREWPASKASVHSASYEFDNIEALSDGIVPASSYDTSIPRFTWWDHKGSEEWVSWRFAEPKEVSRCEVYWFDDGPEGGCRVPASWKVQYREGRLWKDVQGTGFGVEKNAFNAATFPTVTTRDLRLLVQLREGYSGGILEWRVK